MANEASWGNLKNVFGLDDTQVQSLQKAGYTPDQATQLMNLSVGGGGTGTTGTGGSSTRSYPTPSTIGGSGLTPSMLATLGSLLGRGGGGSTVQPVAPANVGRVDPNQTITNLGAAALNERASYGPVPGAETDPMSGVSKATAGYTSSAVPNVQRGPWTQTPGVFVSATGAVSPGTQIAPLPKPGEAPVQKGPKFQGPTQMNLGSSFGVPQPSTPTGTSPFTPTPQATGTQVARPQPWATAPPAPGINLQGVVLPMTGTPPTAPSPISTQPAPYTGTVRNDPFLSNAVSKLMGLGNNPWHPEGSSTTTSSPARPIKMSSGGWVPGDPNDNTDSVPAQLSPGEYVIPKGQASETAHVPIRSSSSYSPPPAPSDQQSTQSPAASTHTDVGAGNETLANLGKLYANTQTNAPNIGSLAGEQAYVTGEPVSGIGGGGLNASQAGAIGGLGSAISQAAQNYAASVKPWQIQKSAIPNPPSYKGPSAQFTQFQVPQSQKQQQTISPFSPYYPYTEE